jgi:5'-deoxynucleotidase YfbR-like HD superfamily hydrolase
MREKADNVTPFPESVTGKDQDERSEILNDMCSMVMSAERLGETLREFLSGDASKESFVDVLGAADTLTGHLRRWSDRSPKDTAEMLYLKHRRAANLYKYVTRAKEHSEMDKASSQK